MIAEDNILPVDEETPKPHHLCGPQVTELVMRKPGRLFDYSDLFNDLFYISLGFLFLNKYYNLLYQALIPNCKLTINILKEHLEITDDTKNYILAGGNPRIKCQRVLNLLIIHLDRERDYMQFCYLFNIISVMTDLPYRLIAGIYSTLVNKYGTSNHKFAIQYFT